MPSMSKRPSARQQRPASRLRLATRFATALVACGLLAAGVLLPIVGGIGFAAGSAAQKFLDTDCSVKVVPPEQTSTILASDGKTVLARLFSQNRQDVPLTQVPQHVQQALIDTEDRRFYSHHGVDLRGIVRAALHNGADDGGGTQGGSTLTMQYVKQLRYYEANTAAQRQAAVQQDLDRKLEDVRCALQLEKHYTKAQILDGYLNIAFFGENSYGIQTAARTYFGVTAAQLTVPQGALLVGLLQSPSSYDPFVNPDIARQRRDAVLANMVTAGDLSAAQARHDEATPLGLATSQPPPVPEGCANASTAVSNVGFFCDYVVNWLETVGKVPESSLLTGGLRIVTTLNASLQNAGQAAIWQAGLDPNSPTALVMPSVEPHTGAVQTMITSRRYGLNPSQGQTTLPLFTTGYAGSGSTYKYFTTLAALKLGAQPDFTLTTGSDSYTVQNCPIDPNDSVTVPYTTHNAGTYNATLPLSDALPESVNTYFVGLEDQFFGCDLSPIVNTALGLGMTALNQPQSAGASTSIAQAVISQHQAGFTLGFSPTAPLQLTAAYGAVANDGVYCPPDPIVSISQPDGAALKFTRPACTRQFSPQVARTMVNMMTADTDSYKGTAVSYFRDWYGAGGSPVASKTGTDNDDPAGPDGGNGNSALWFVGVTPSLVSAAALVNPISPKATVTGLPADVTNNGADVFGAYASTYWLDAYGPTLQSQHWTWPQAGDLPGVTTVPDVTGMTLDQARSGLAASGFKIAVAQVQCGSPQPAGDAGYYEPHLAAPGATITVCPSNGKTPSGYYARQYSSGVNSAPGETSSATATAATPPATTPPATTPPAPTPPAAQSPSAPSSHGAARPGGSGRTPG